MPPAEMLFFYAQRTVSNRAKLQTFNPAVTLSLPQRPNVNAKDPNWKNQMRGQRQRVTPTSPIMGEPVRSATRIE